jgi:cyclophilin family peptidyl-prolyl cis-trans isomerase
MPQNSFITLIVLLSQATLLKAHILDQINCEVAQLSPSILSLLFCNKNLVNDSIKYRDKGEKRIYSSNKFSNLAWTPVRCSLDTQTSQNPMTMSSSSRRDLFNSFLGLPLCIQALSRLSHPVAAAVMEASTVEAKITDKIFIEFSGLLTPAADDSTGSNTNVNPNNNRIVIGLFGEDAPGPVSIIKQLVSEGGYPSKCKPREERMLQKEQLEANKVYNTCKENEDKGVTYDLSQVWRVSNNKRIDLGAVSGKYVAREYPSFFSEESSSTLRHDSPGVVSVRRGNDGGFGFTIYPGGGPIINEANDLDKENIVIGRVLEGMDVVLRINEVPVIQSAKLSFSEKERAGPSRACRYGSTNLYCNELKPLRKLMISKTGIIAS